MAEISTKPNNKALVVLSGGQDSTTCLFWAKKEFKEVYAISFNYGQKHQHETAIAQSIAERAGVSFKPRISAQWTTE